MFEETPAPSDKKSSPIYLLLHIEIYFADYSYVLVDLTIGNLGKQLLLIGFGLGVLDSANSIVVVTHSTGNIPVCD